MRWSIRRKLTLSILFISLTSIGVVGMHAIRVSHEALEQRIGQGLRKQALAMMSQLDRMLFERYRNVQNWASEEILLDVLSNDKDKRITEFLTAMKKEYGLYADLIVTDNAGTIIAASNPLLIEKKVNEEPWFQGALSKKEIKTVGLTRSKLTGGHVAAFAAPILTEKIIHQMAAKSTDNDARKNMLEAVSAWKTETIGVLTAFLNWSEIIDTVNSLNIVEGKSQNQHAYAMLIDDQGYALTQPYFDNQAVMLRENLIKNGLEAARRASERNSGYIIEPGRYNELDFVGFAHSSGYRDFKGFDWAILIFQNTKEALSVIQPLKVQIYGIGIIVAVVSTLITFMLTTGISAPIESLAEFARKVGRGDFSGKTNVNTDDEVGTLAISFNEMIRGLKKAKEEMTEARDFADNIIRSTADALLVVNQDGKVRVCNPSVTTILGYPSSELLGRSIEKIFSPEQIQDKKMMSSLQSGRVLNSDMECLSKDGNLIPMLISSSIIKDQLGRSLGVVVIAKDMREYKSLELQFREAQKMDAVGKLTSGIAHDFNNMLTVINGYSEKILRKLGETDPRGGEAGQILKAGRRAARLVAQLLAFSRRQIIKPVVLDPNEVIVGMDKMFRLMTGSKVEVVTLPMKNLWPIKIDPGQFEQVLANMVVNARDAMPDGGKVILGTRNIVADQQYVQSRPGLLPGEYVLVSVEDTGTGMTEEIKKKIFEPFFTTKPKGKGTGLGLATCYSVVKQYNGYIDVETVLGRGTTFFIYFPKSEGKPEGVSDEEHNKSIPTGTETILLVEDEYLVREFTQKQLVELGYTVYSTLNGSEALTFLEEHSDKKIDLIVTDVVMPKLGGRELAERVMKLYPSIKILFMSGYADDETVQEGIANQTIAFLQKPITPLALALKVREVLDPPISKAA